MKNKTYETLLLASFNIELNANDYFYYATAMSVTIDYLDYRWILETIDKFPERGMDGCMAYIQNQTPISPWVTTKFTEVIEYLKNKNQEVFGDSDYSHTYNYKEEIYRKVNHNFV